MPPAVTFTFDFRAAVAFRAKGARAFFEREICVRVSVFVCLCLSLSLCRPVFFPVFVAAMTHISPSFPPPLSHFVRDSCAMASRCSSA